MNLHKVSYDLLRQLSDAQSKVIRLLRLVFAWPNFLAFV